MAFFRIGFISLFGVLVCTSLFAGVGSEDKREYVNWKDYPQIVHLKMHVRKITRGQLTGESYGNCTGQFVAPNLILTAAHCIKDNNGNMKAGYESNFAINYKNEQFEIKYEVSPNNYTDSDETLDWAIFRVTDPRFYSYDVYDLKTLKESQSVDVYNAGFGWVTILESTEIKKLKNVYENYMKSTDYPTMSELKQLMTKDLKRSLEDNFKEHKLKVDKTCSVEYKKGLIKGKCDVWEGNSGGVFSTRNGTNFLVGILSGGEVNEWDFDDKTHFAGGPSVKYFYDELQRLKEKYPVEQTGNLEKSEMPIVSTVASVTDGIKQNKKRSNVDVPARLSNFTTGDIIGALNTNKSTSNSKDVYTTRTVPLPKEHVSEQEQTDSSVERLPDFTPSEILDMVNTPEHVFTSIEQNVPTLSDAEIQELDKELEDKKKRQEQKFKKVSEKKKISDAEFIHGILEPVVEINRIEQLQNIYKSAKDTETSFENRMLGGATMAAMGIGGMEMARGIAEQNADNEADAIMDAYLKTFQCQIGEKGKTYSGGERNIEVPGANVLTDLYQQYTSIAESIKTKKTALGMRPGIESEIVLDKSGTGLYENAGSDTQSVKYASRYRAAMGSEKDTEDLQTETNKTTARALGGAAGVVGGATIGLYGNSVINGDNQGLNLNLGDIDMSTVGSIATEYMQSSE